jgi:hypothetical protein
MEAKELLHENLLWKREYDEIETAVKREYAEIEAKIEAAVKRVSGVSGGSKGSGGSGYRIWFRF